MKTLATSQVVPFVRHAVRAGWSQEALADLCARHDIDRAAFDSLTGRVPREEAFALIEEICAVSGDPNLGLHLAFEASASWMSIIGVIGMNLTSIREAIEVCGDYGRRFNPGAARCNFPSDVDGRFHLGGRDPELHGRFQPRQLVEAEIAACVVLLRRFTGMDIKALQVSFPHAAPADVAEHVAFFGTKDIRFGAPVAEAIFPASVLDLRNQGPDLGLAAYMRRQAEALLEASSGSDELVGAVRQSLCDVLDRGGEASLRGTARRLKMASRTLQRRLAEAGVQFSTLLEEVRCERAIALLRRPRADIEDIAGRVGFSDSRSLRRALKRRTGRSFAELRRDDYAGL